MASKQEKLVADLAETLHPPPRRDLTFYVVFFVAVLPLWSIVPTSWVFVIYTLHYGLFWTFAWRGWCLFVLALCEVFFSVYHYNLASFISGPSPNGPGNLHELQAVLMRVLQAGLAALPEEGFDEETLDVDRPGSPAETLTALDYHDPRAVDFRNYLRTWFGKAPWSSIRRHEMFAWLYWSIFNAPFPGIDNVSESHRKVLLEVIKMLEMRAGAEIPEGSNPAAAPLLLTLDPVNVAWRPLVWYAGVNLSNQYLRRRLRTKWNVKIGVYKDLEYVLRVPPQWNAHMGPRPIVFMHGLGLGLTQYRRFIEHMFVSLPEHPVLVPLLPHVSQEILHARYLKPMGRHEMTDCLAGLLNELGWADLEAPSPETSDSEDKATDGRGNAEDTARGRVPKGVTMFSHSNGSFGHAWMLKTYPRMITRSCFVDPVTFCSWEGDLCYNFIYRPSVNGLDLVIKYFVGTELGVANFLQRHFDWSANCLWYEEIPNARDPRKTMFVLGGKDSIIDAYRVKRYLTSHGIRKGLHFDPDGRHGQALLSGSPGHREILRWLREQH
ncbi:hypothetical protein BN946_scf184908.g13 [Trametes cinnabarina]|uniref:AB hydrolase-1 domain-containing protein n=1 Tax=Pycnoporus cinnabarinus TaxID=5643 RepID=A0A060SAJ4_PYCCI|nr:hypothetical protein BN946_scf184908.g13 [Trametes cinnabarina]